MDTEAAPRFDLLWTRWTTNPQQMNKSNRWSTSISPFSTVVHRAKLPAIPTTPLYAPYLSGSSPSVIRQLRLVAWHSGRTSVSDRRTFPVPLSTCSWWVHDQWRIKALRGPSSTVTWGHSIPSASPQGLKLEARSAESKGGALGLVYALYRFLLLTCQFFRSGVFFSCVFFWPRTRSPQELGAPVHWTARTPGRFYATVGDHYCRYSAALITNDRNHSARPSSRGNRTAPSRVKLAIWSNERLDSTLFNRDLFDRPRRSVQIGPRPPHDYALIANSIVSPETPITSQSFHPDTTRNGSLPFRSLLLRRHLYSAVQQKKQESLALASMARDDPPASSTAATMCGKVGSEFET